MCGIAGFFVGAGATAGAAADLPAAVASLYHRGPDDGGQWLSDDGRVGLGHRRLSILDLSAHGHQPMFSADGQWAMVFNGEIYNFREIRAELEPLGHRFAGTGDSEVILAAFGQWGVREALRRFIGMFAIALWHRPQRKLYLIRDRVGVKPLYYAWDGRDLYFGSELKALRAFGGWPVALDRDAMVDYFRYGYIVDPRSIYRNVFKLRPGHWLELDDAGHLQETAYWSVLDAPAHPPGESEESLADRLEALMTSAFGYRMIADVPVGVFLSGGIDSSMLAAILQKHGGQRIKTFTIGFDEAERNEAPYAEAVARHLGTEHHTRVLSVDEAMRTLPSWGDLYDEPFGDSSGIPTLLVSRVAGEQVKVVLSADGGDELFSGYTTYTGITAQAQRLLSKPAWLRRSVGAALRTVPWQAMDDALAAQAAGGEALRRLRYATTVRFAKISDRIGVGSVGGIFDQALREANWPDRLLRPLLGAAPDTRATADAFHGNGGGQMCLWDLHNYLPGDILTKVDRATMRASIEGREPLLDHRLIEFAFALPYALRQGPLGPKHLLRKVLYRHVPRELIDRPKQGFAIPLERWLRGGLHSLIECYLSPTRIAGQGLFDPPTVQALRRRFDAGDALSTQPVWLMLAFQMWHERWMESPLAAAVPRTPRA
ncbi:asparagine synthase (glutamine-hydrolyzing) [Ideonella sp. A 288]|uniref:asparagine synthase (glutamine-hydrolyzing) n=1 Tax=Ideonella sp. A 288 TaxID=1962181 RepID=UPI000B4B2564|nr:asparagine synthase (glutamine-hydrolyzing) [Ideonella sp. A 288]